MTFPVWQITNLRSSAFLASLTSLRKMTYRFVPFVFCTKSAQKKDLNAIWQILSTVFHASEMDYIQRVSWTGDLNLV